MRGQSVDLLALSTSGMLVLFSRAQSLFSSNERHIVQDMWAADVSDVDVLFIFGLLPSMELLGAKLVAELPPQSYVVANEAPFDKTPGLIEIGIRRFGDASPLRLYRIAREKMPPKTSGSAAQEGAAVGGDSKAE